MCSRVEQESQDRNKSTTSQARASQPCLKIWLPLKPHLKHSSANKHSGRRVIYQGALDCSPPATHHLQYKLAYVLLSLHGLSGAQDSHADAYVRLVGSRGTTVVNIRKQYEGIGQNETHCWSGSGRRAELVKAAST